jgi:hexosaminidase
VIADWGNKRSRLKRSYSVILLALAVTTETRAQYALIPTPREYAEDRSVSLARGVALHCQFCSAEDRFAAADLQQRLREDGIQFRPTGVPIDFLPADSSRARALMRQQQLQWQSEQMGPEGYVIVRAGKGVAVIASSFAGRFYGAQTVKQLVDTTSQPAVLHIATIRDWPAMKVRGLSDDLSRGPVPTVEFMKKQIRTMAEYKMNLYSPYFEHTFRHDSNLLVAPADGAITPAEGRELVAYAQKYHVTIVPEQEAFGHLHNVLKWEMYAPLAETPHGQVLTPVAPGSLEMPKQMFSELARVFPGPYLHLGADETQELGKGRTKADVQSRGLGAAYLDFLQRLVTELRPLNRTLLFWGDVAMHSPELVRALPEDFKRSTIAIPWEYDAHPEGFARYITPFTQAGIPCWVAPGVNNWSRVYPNFAVAFSNIQGFAADGQAGGCTGQMNTVWNDDGETLFNSNWYGILFGAAAAWQPGRASIDSFNAAYGRVFHAEGSGKVVEAQRELMAAHTLLQQKYKRSDASDSMFWIDPWSVDGQRIAPLIRPYLSELRLHAERAIVLTREARQTPGVRETDALDTMELGARRIDLMAYKFQLSDEIATIYQSAQIAAARGNDGRAEAAEDLQSLDSTNGKLQDLRDGYTECREMYQRAWAKSYRPYWLENNLARYDLTIQLWVSRIDRMRSAQRQLMYDHTLPTAEAMGIPAADAGGHSL